MRVGKVEWWKLRAKVDERIEPSDSDNQYIMIALS